VRKYVSILVLLSECDCRVSPRSYLSGFGPLSEGGIKIVRTLRCGVEAQLEREEATHTSDKEHRVKDKCCFGYDLLKSAKLSDMYVRQAAAPKWIYLVICHGSGQSQPFGPHIHRILQKISVVSNVKPRDSVPPGRLHIINSVPAGKMRWKWPIIAFRLVTPQKIQLLIGHIKSNFFGATHHVQHLTTDSCFFL
jgi:hypothetical protein